MTRTEWVVVVVTVLLLCTSVVLAVTPWSHLAALLLGVYLAHVVRDVRRGGAR